MPNEIEKPAAEAAAAATAETVDTSAATDGTDPAALAAIAEDEAGTPLEDMRLFTDDEPAAAAVRAKDGKFQKAGEEPAEPTPAEDPAKPVVPPLPDLDAIRARRSTEKAAKLAADLEREKISREAIEADRAKRTPEVDPLVALKAKAKADARTALTELGTDQEAIDNFVDAEIERRLAAADAAASGVTDGTRNAAAAGDPEARKKITELEAKIAAREAADAAREANEKAARDRDAVAYRQTVEREAVALATKTLSGLGDRYETILALDKAGAVYEEFVDYARENGLSFKSDEEAIPYLLAIADRCEIALDKENERRAATKKFQARFAPREAGKSQGTPAKANGAGKKPSGVSARAATGKPTNQADDDLPDDFGARVAALDDFRITE